MGNTCIPSRTAGWAASKSFIHQVNEELWREENELTNSRPSSPRTLARPAPARGRPPGPAPRAPGRAPAQGWGWGRRVGPQASLVPLPSPSPSFHLLLYNCPPPFSAPSPYRVRSGAGRALHSRPSTRSPARKGAGAARRAPRLVPAQVGVRCPVPSRAGAGRGSGRDRSASHPPAPQDRSREGGWGEAGGDGEEWKVANSG